MTQNVLIVHGWDGDPKEGWFPWLAQALTKQGYKVQIPQMPETDHPKINVWVPYLRTLIDQSGPDLLLVGHSLGCQTILRALESLPEDRHVGPIYLVAPFFELTHLETAEETSIAQPWLDTPIDCTTVKLRAGKITALFSDNDHFVPLTNVQLFQDLLDAETHIYPSRGHLSGEDGNFTFPELLALIDANSGNV